jgi:hypothetical protein
MLLLVLRSPGHDDAAQQVAEFNGSNRPPTAPDAPGEAMPRLNSHIIRKPEGQKCRCHKLPSHDLARVRAETRPL